MRSVRLYSSSATCNSYYSEIQDIHLYPSGEIRNTSLQDTEKENVYDEPNLTEPKPAAGVPQGGVNSKFEVPRIYVSSESDESDMENESGGSSLPYLKPLHQTTVENSLPELILSDFHGSFPNHTQHSLPTIPEHPYHVLEQPVGIFDAMDYHSPLELQDGPLTSNFILGFVNEDNEYDRLVDPELYSMLDHSIGNPSQGISKVYDIQNGPYSRLEATSQRRPKGRSVADIHVVAEIFDDSQYVGPTPKLATEIDLGEGQKLSETATSMSSSGARMVGGKNISKYKGNYERDPVYMEKRLGVKPTATYQPLEVIAMDPVKPYDKPKKQ
jgi:hypothetical protein